MIASPETQITTVNWLSSLTQIVIAAMWPAVVIMVGWYQREPIHALLTSLSELAKSANKIKIWQVEVERKVDDVLAESAKGADASFNEDLAVPPSEVVAAAKVETLVSSVPSSEAKIGLSQGLRSKLIDLAHQYDAVRIDLPSSSERTRKMNGIMAQMRTLGISGRPFLSEFCSSKTSHGIRLAAIAILQITPDASYLEWLVDRASEDQAFLIFHSSLALLAAVRSYGTLKKEALESAISRSLATVRAFRGYPDKNAIAVLESALHELADES